jgi:hypothetical protein
MFFKRYKTDNPRDNDNKRKIISWALLFEYRGTKTLSKAPTPARHNIIPFTPTGNRFRNGRFLFEFCILLTTQKKYALVLFFKSDVAYLFLYVYVKICLGETYQKQKIGTLLYIFIESSFQSELNLKHVA